MITDADVTKLKETFFTKADVEKLKETFFTKEDAEKLKETFFTKADAEKLKDTFATKNDLVALEKRLETSFTKKFATKQDLAALEKRIDKKFVTKREFTAFVEEMADFRIDTAERLENIEGLLTTKLDYILVTLDTLTGQYQVSLDEHRAGASILARHDRQIGALAIATGVTLPE